MKGFAVFCLAIILIAVQHFVNWIWRYAKKANELSEDPFAYILALTITCVAVFITCEGGMTLAQWIDS